MLKALDIWLPSYLRRPRIKTPAAARHLLLCVCDHFEPLHATTKAGAMDRVELWRTRFPELAEPFRDSGGVRPKQTFFYPVEQYDPDLVGKLADLCHATGCETEIHLHHDRDTADNLRKTLECGKKEFAGHGLLSRDPTGRIRYGFIHGDWALDNSGPQGRRCGVCNELAVLQETGCYADFTMPAAPNRAQTRIINSLYYASGTPAPKSHDRGIPAAVGRKNSDGLLLVQGPLGLNWKRRKFGVLPRIENADLTGANPPTPDRLRIWMDLNIHVRGNPEWLFVKLHTHGGIPRNSGMLLGEPMRDFHRHLARLAEQENGFHFHYVTAREMVNILHAAEDGHSGDPGQFRDYRYQSF